ncbi:YhjD/YihY/BrkB family envelope integrity protein [Streptomyces sp. 891-h]|uniref:YhjD/YihY/BrkB family envelope integrity protein n=1 Tax=unclassified Streptomyces TaxID=2593676 RepID=UPI001FA95DD6|nr:YhjD/YihY/BrkB family envelope integrity protein [Streptomyces sp. 891-h]
MAKSPGGRVWQHGAEFELLRRAMSFAVLAFVALVPLLIVVAALDPVKRAGFDEWIVNGMGLENPSAADNVRDLFSPPRQVVNTTSVLSAVLLALFGVTFAASVQTGYEKIWGLPPSRTPHKVWRQVVWLAVLTGYLFAEVESEDALQPGVARSVARVVLTLLTGMLFFWWSQHFLLTGRVSWRCLLPGAVATMLGLTGLRIFSYFVFSPLIISSRNSYGAAGTLLIVQSWLIGVGFVVFGGPLFGHHVRNWLTGIARSSDSGDSPER